MFDDTVTNDVDGVCLPSPVTDIVVEENREYISAAEKTVPCEPVMKIDVESTHVQELHATYLDSMLDREVHENVETDDKTAVVTRAEKELWTTPEQQLEEDLDTAAEAENEVDEHISTVKTDDVVGETGDLAESDLLKETGSSEVLEEEMTSQMEEAVVVDDARREDTKMQTDSQAVQPSVMVTVAESVSLVHAKEPESIDMPQTVAGVDETSVLLQEEEKENVESLQVEMEETATVSDTVVEVTEIERKKLETEESTVAILSIHTQDEVVKREEEDEEQLSVDQETTQEEQVETSWKEVVQMTETEIGQVQPQKVADDASSAEKYDEIQETQREVIKPKEMEELLDITTVTATQTQQIDSWKYEPQRAPEVVVQEAEAYTEQQREVVEETPPVETQDDVKLADKLISVRPVEAEELEDVTAATETEIVTDVAREEMEPYDVQLEEEVEEETQHETVEEPLTVREEEMVTKVQETTSTTITETGVVLVTVQAEVDSYRPVSKEAVEELSSVEEAQHEVEQPSEMAELPVGRVDVEEEMESSEAEATEAGPVMETHDVKVLEKDVEPHKLEAEAEVTEEFSSVQAKHEEFEVKEPQAEGLLDEPIALTETEITQAVVTKELETSTSEHEQVEEEMSAVDAEKVESPVETVEQTPVIESQDEALQIVDILNMTATVVKDVTMVTESEVELVAETEEAVERRKTEGAIEVATVEAAQHETLEESLVIGQDERVAPLQIETGESAIAVLAAEEKEDESDKGKGFEKIQAAEMLHDADQPVSKQTVEFTQVEVQEITAMLDSKIEVEEAKGVEPCKPESEEYVHSPAARSEADTGKQPLLVSEQEIEEQVEEIKETTTLTKTVSIAIKDTKVIKTYETQSNVEEIASETEAPPITQPETLSYSEKVIESSETVAEELKRVTEVEIAGRSEDLKKDMSDREFRFAVGSGQPEQAVVDLPSLRPEDEQSQSPETLSKEAEPLTVKLVAEDSPGNKAIETYRPQREDAAMEAELLTETADLITEKPTSAAVTESETVDITMSTTEAAAEPEDTAEAIRHLPIKDELLETQATEAEAVVITAKTEVTEVEQEKDLSFADVQQDEMQVEILKPSEAEMKESVAAVVTEDTEAATEEEEGKKGDITEYEESLLEGSLAQRIEVTEPLEEGSDETKSITMVPVEQEIDTWKPQSFEAPDLALQDEVAEPSGTEEKMPKAVTDTMAHDGRVGEIPIREAESEAEAVSVEQGDQKMVASSAVKEAEPDEVVDEEVDFMKPVQEPTEAEVEKTKLQSSTVEEDTTIDVNLLQSKQSVAAATAAEDERLENLEEEETAEAGIADRLEQEVKEMELADNKVPAKSEFRVVMSKELRDAVPGDDDEGLVEFEKVLTEDTVTDVTELQTQKHEDDQHDVNETAAVPVRVVTEEKVKAEVEEKIELTQESTEEQIEEASEHDEILLTMDAEDTRSPALGIQEKAESQEELIMTKGTSAEQTICHEIAKDETAELVDSTTEKIQTFELAAETDEAKTQSTAAHEITTVKVRIEAREEVTETPSEDAEVLLLQVPEAESSASEEVRNESEKALASDLISDEELESDLELLLEESRIKYDISRGDESSPLSELLPKDVLKTTILEDRVELPRAISDKEQPQKGEDTRQQLSESGLREVEDSASGFAAEIGKEQGEGEVHDEKRIVSPEEVSAEEVIKHVQEEETLLTEGAVTTDHRTVETTELSDSETHADAATTDISDDLRAVSSGIVEEMMQKVLQQTLLDDVGIVYPKTLSSEAEPTDTQVAEPQQLTETLGVAEEEVSREHGSLAEEEKEGKFDADGLETHILAVDELSTSEEMVENDYTSDASIVMQLHVDETQTEDQPGSDEPPVASAVVFEPDKIVQPSDKIDSADSNLVRVDESVYKTDDKVLSDEAAEAADLPDLPDVEGTPLESEDLADDNLKIAEVAETKATSSTDIDDTKEIIHEVAANLVSTVIKTAEKLESSKASSYEHAGVQKSREASVPQTLGTESERPKVVQVVRSVKPDGEITEHVVSVDSASPLEALGALPSPQTSLCGESGEESEPAVSSAAIVYADTVEERPDSETEMTEYEEILPDGSIVRRKVVKTTRQQAVTRRVVVQETSTEHGQLSTHVEASPGFVRYSDRAEEGPVTVTLSDETFHQTLPDGRPAVTHSTVISQQKLVMERTFMDVLETSEDTDLKTMDNVLSSEAASGTFC